MTHQVGDLYRYELLFVESRLVPSLGIVTKVNLDKEYITLMFGNDELDFSFWYIECHTEALRKLA